MWHFVPWPALQTIDPHCKNTPQRFLRVLPTHPAFYVPMSCFDLFAAHVFFFHLQLGGLCPFVGNKASMNEHIAECQFALTACPQRHVGCDVVLPRNKMGAHDCRCGAVTVRCTHCESSMRQENLGQHLKVGFAD